MIQMVCDIAIVQDDIGGFDQFPEHNIGKLVPVSTEGLGCGPLIVAVNVIGGITGTALSDHNFIIAGTAKVNG